MEAGQDLCRRCAAKPTEAEPVAKSELAAEETKFPAVLVEQVVQLREMASINIDAIKKYPEMREHLVGRAGGFHGAAKVLCSIRGMSLEQTEELCGGDVIEFITKEGQQ